jgi:hypothetical protein
MVFDNLVHLDLILLLIYRKKVPNYPVCSLPVGFWCRSPRVVQNSESLTPRNPGNNHRMRSFHFHLQYKRSSGSRFHLRIHVQIFQLSCQSHIHICIRLVEGGVWVLLYLENSESLLLHRFQDYSNYTFLYSVHTTS